MHANDVTARAGAYRRDEDAAGATHHFYVALATRPEHTTTPERLADVAADSVRREVLRYFREREKRA